MHHNVLFVVFYLNLDKLSGVQVDDPPDEALIALQLTNRLP